MVTTALVPLSTPTPFLGDNNTRWQWRGPTNLIRNPQLKLTIPLPSSSSSTPSPVVEDGPSSPPDALPLQSESASDDGTFKVPLGGCKGCGKEVIERGCNGEGRIQGGIATVPGFGWWPIKAYRPCPGFLASGGRYRRQGQSMDEVAFGRGGKGASPRDSSEVQSSKKKKGAKKSK